jgi:mutator protein MutT
MSESIIVVHALIVNPDNKRVLMAHRPPNKKKPLLWEYPGGKVEVGESLSDAVKREVKEELDLDAVVGDCIAKETFAWKDNVQLYLFTIKSWVGEPKPLASTEIQWVHPELAVDYLPMTPGSYMAYREVLSYLKQLS